MKRICLLPVVSLLFFLPSSQGQLGLYGGFSAAHTNVANDPWFYGSNFGLYYNVLKLPLLNVGLNGEGSIVNGTGNITSQRITSGFAGPRAEFHLPLIPLKPYAEGDIGGSRVEVGQGSARTEKTVLSYGFSAGADLTIFPLLDWRVAEYTYARFNTLPGLNQSTLTTGLVLRLPIP